MELYVSKYDSRSYYLDEGSYLAKGSYRVYFLLFFFILSSTNTQADEADTIDFSALLKTEWAYGTVEHSNQKMEFIF
ncbi:MAG: hypothetical protein GQ546_04755 [Gammaproteobacteria bacterium]|nr:hypothetical protein [Gammaproteobacteria bacterium]